MKRAAAVLVVLAVLLAAFPAAAAVSFEQVNWTEKNGGVQIEGRISSGGAAVSVVILQPEYSALDETDLKKSCAYMRTVQAAADGTFQVTAALQQGDYPLVLTAQGAQHRAVVSCRDSGNATKTIFIAPGGSDENGFGTEAAPFAGFDKALQAAQSLLENTDVEIIFRGGAYTMQQSCVIRAQQSGKNGHQLRIRAAEGENVQVTFARTVTGWENVGNNIWRAPLQQGEKPESLYENGKLAVPARSPNRQNGKNCYVHSAAADSAQPNQAFYTEPGQFAQPENISGLEVFLWPGGKNGHYNWSTQLIAIENFDAASGHVTLVRKAAYEIGAGSRYYLQGAPEFLDAPGEFYADTAAGNLYYYPYDTTALTEGVSVPLKADGFRLEGTEEAPIQNVIIEGIAVSGVDTPGRGIRLLNASNCAA